MIEAYVRHKIQPLFNTIGTFIFVPLKLSPNNITLIAFISGILSGLLVAGNKLIPALLLLLFSGLCDIMDGTVARITHTSHPIGAYMDLISDRMVESALILGFSILYPQYYLVYILFLIAVLLHFSTFVTAGALFKNHGSKSMHHDHSTIERAEAFMVFAFMILMPQYIFNMLTVFSSVIILDALARFYRIMKYAYTHNQV